ncbi:hypothetical protein SAMD00023353_3200910 [Rosellinia necatrix]|uniref:Uncharacterized protein n=1 Tax=Rosellinia necatrix TaxID=77044 RepID=A0A1S8A8S5_ROSNE|nr:hypothetical protein SAMD00023353_3200910 [Rosellinia necatrix]
MDAESSNLANPRSPLEDAIADFQLVLDHDQRTKLSGLNTVPDADSILVFTAQLDLANRNRRGKSIGSRLYTVLSSVRDFCTVVDVFVSSHPEVAALVWGSVKLTMQIIVNYTSYFEATSELFMRIGRLCPLFTEYQALYPASQRLQDALSDFHAAIIRCCKHVIHASQKPWINQTLSAMWRPFDDEFKVDLVDLDNCSNSVKEAIDAAKAHADAKEHELQARERKEASQGRAMISQLVKRTDDGWRETRQWQLECDLRRTRERKQHVLDSLSTYNHLRSLKQNQRKRYCDTANWIFQASEFISWANQLDDTLLWCSGKIGSGKTVAITSVIDHLLLTKTDTDIMVFFFFIRSDDKMSLKAETIIKSILRQGLPCAAELSDEMENKIQVAVSSEDVGRIIALLDDITAGRTKFYIIIDGLDECDKWERTILIKGLACLSSRRTNVKLLLASRESLLDEICRCFPSFQRIATGGTGTYGDIATYVTGVVDERAKNGELRIGNAGILEEVKTALIEGADGMFLWVFFQIQEICSQHCDEDVRNAIQNLPRGLPETFRRALRRIKAENHAQAAIRTFPLIAAAVRPLSLDELQAALAVEIGQQRLARERLFNDLDRIALWCQNLVQTDEEDLTVRFVHQAVRQFLLEDPVELDLTSFHFKMRDADHTMGEICLTYLNFQEIQMRRPVLLPSPLVIIENAYGKRSIPALLLRSISDPASPVVPINVEPIMNAIGSHSSGVEYTQRYPLLEYASANWDSHTRYFSAAKSITWELWKKKVVEDYDIYCISASDGVKSLRQRERRTGHPGVIGAISSLPENPGHRFITGRVERDGQHQLRLIVKPDGVYSRDARRLTAEAFRVGGLKVVKILSMDLFDEVEIKKLEE